MPTPFAQKLADVTQAQFDLFHGQHEGDPALFKAIKKWNKDLHLAPDFDPVSQPWSALFVSWCVFTAGATAAEFKFALAHSQFDNQAIKNADSDTGVFQAFQIDEVAPQLGDIIQQNRGGNTFDFAFARTHRSYISHSAIVVDDNPGLADELGRFLLTVGGNEGDSVRATKVRLTAKGLIKPRRQPVHLRRQKPEVRTPTARQAFDHRRLAASNSTLEELL